MAGFVAVHDPGAGAEPDAVERMLAALDHRGRDGSDAVVREGVGLGHQQFRSTPEESGVSQPVRVGDRLVAVDGRVDNRAAVADALPGSVPADASDAELFGRAHAAWGEGLVDRIVGVYGLAIHDPTDSTLFCARDPTGVRQVYHASVGGAVLVGSEVGALLAHPELDPPANEGLLAAYLVGETPPGTETFYEGVRRLPPGGVLLARDGDATVERRRNVAAEAEPLDLDEDALVERFRELLAAAVDCRLRTRDRPGVLMSGGLDSTSVACVAARSDRPTGRVRSFSAVFDDLGDETVVRAERDRIRAVGDDCGVESYEVVVDDRWPLREPAVQWRALREGPCLNVLRPANVACYRAAAGAGTSILLTGHGGDLQAGNRSAYLDLLRAGRVRRLLAELRADPIPAHLLVLWYLLLPTLPRLAGPVVAALADGDAGGLPAWLDGSFVDRVDLRAQLEGDGRPDRPTRAAMRETYEQFFGTRREFHWALGHAAALRHGVELRYPLADQRVVSFVFSLPTGSRLRDGTDKRLVRTAMAEVLPETVRRQSRGASFDALVERGLRDREADRIRELLTDTRLEVRGVVDGDVLRRTVDRYLAGDGPDDDDVWRLATAERWLRRLDDPAGMGPTGRP